MSDRRYPIGEFAYTGTYSPAERESLVARIESLPRRMRGAVEGLPDGQLATPYREGGWTVRQVVHHVADSHAHSLLRFKFALARDGAAIVSYPEELWALLPDYSAPVGQALDLIDAVHAKWVYVLRAMRPEDFARAYAHPENGRVSLDRALGLYAWHGDHHLAHVRLAAG